MKIKRFFWRGLLILIKPWFYISDWLDHQYIETETDYADGEGWSFERTRVLFLQKWYKY